MVKIYCSECGKLHESESKFCQHCGHDLEGAILRYKQKHLPIKYQGAASGPSGAISQGGVKQEKSGGGTVALVFGIMTLISGVGEIFILIFADWTQPIFITLAIIFGIVLLISLVTVSTLTGCCDASGCSGCSGCDCGGCDIGDCASGCSGCDCGGCDISC